MMLSKSELLDLFHYEHETGLLIRKVSNNRAIKVGSVAGGKNAIGYVCLKINGYGYYAHRVIWVMVYGSIPTRIHHINGNKNDNRISNLELVK